ncbi:MAG: diguanylate cyclase [Sulfurimonas sp.]|nr:diguanylate cyclase [Sulfurimonas sp.]
MQPLKHFYEKKKKLNLILLNIDNFSNINDSYGIEYGDFVFTKVLEILNTLCSNNIDIYKLESDEFALVNQNNLDINTAEDTAKLLTSFFLMKLK